MSSIAGLATGIGSLLVLAAGQPGRSFLAWLLGLAAGIMLSITVSELVPTAWQAGGAVALIKGGLPAVALLVLLDRLLLPVRVAERGGYLRLGYLIGTTIALHDLPEGMAIAVGFAVQPDLGLSLALAIGLHNLPEGMATAAPLMAGGVAPVKILAWSALLAACTPLGAALGLAAAVFSPPAIAPLLAAAAAAMSYVVVRELLPVVWQEASWVSLFGLVLGLAAGRLA